MEAFVDQYVNLVDITIKVTMVKTKQKVRIGDRIEVRTLMVKYQGQRQKLWSEPKKKGLTTLCTTIVSFHIIY